MNISLFLKLNYTQWLIIALTISCLITGCGNANPETNQTASASPTAEVAPTPTNTPLAQLENEIDPEAIIIGLDADMSSGSAEAGEAIRRGAILAIEEINEQGGVLGKPLQLLVKDHRGNPTRGVDNVNTFAELDNLVAILGGLHTPVILEALDTIHQHQLIYLVPWAAGTPIIDNGFEPNMVFRVSVRDQYAGGFLIEQALQKGYQKPGLLLEQTGWGRSNEQAMTTALANEGLTPAGIQWFNWGTTDMTEQINNLANDQADVIMLVANSPEGVAAVNTVASFSEENRLPIISHWGITGGHFFEDAKDTLPQIDLQFLQTFSFLNPPFPDRAESFITAYCAQFECQTESAHDIFSPVGTAHAYDLIHLLKLAIEQANTTESQAVRTALEDLETSYAGLLRDYTTPFTPDNHDALDATDMNLAQYDNQGIIIPISQVQ